MSKKTSLWKGFFLIIYIGFMITLIIAAAGYLTVFLVGTLGNPFAKKQAQVSSADVFDSVVALTEKKVVRYLGEWEFLEPKLPGHFHHVGRWYQSDKWNFCVKCHGPIPHSRSTSKRAFLNMHNLFIACHVCHIQEEKSVAPTRFGWIDINNGQMCSNPEMGKGVWGEYGAKIIPLKGPDGNSQPVTLEEEEAFTVEFRDRENKLDDQQRVIGNKFIHRKCVETPVRCSDCHNTEKAFIPYTDLGYSSERAAFLVSAEVVDLVARYETFYIPNLLKADEQMRESTNGRKD